MFSSLRLPAGDDARDKGPRRFERLYGPDEPRTNNLGNKYCAYANNPIYSPCPEYRSDPLITCNASGWTPCDKEANGACMRDNLPGGGPDGREKGDFGQRGVEAEAETV